MKTPFLSKVSVPTLLVTAAVLLASPVGAQEESEADAAEGAGSSTPSDAVELFPLPEEPALPEGAAQEPSTPDASESRVEDSLSTGDGADGSAAVVPDPLGLDPTELVLKDGRVLKDYQIHSWNTTTLTIFHRTGAANVPAHLLPDVVIKAYRMDPKLSAEQEQTNRTKRTEEAIANLQAMDERRALRRLPSVTVKGTVSSVGSDGLALLIEDPQEIAGKGYQRIGGMIYDKNGKPVSAYRGQIFGTVWVTDHPLQAVVVDGDLLQFQGRVSGRRQVEGKTYPSVRFEKSSR